MFLYLLYTSRTILEKLTGFFFLFASVQLRYYARSYMDNLSAPSALYRQNPETNAINCLLADFNEGKFQRHCDARSCNNNHA